MMEIVSPNYMPELVMEDLNFFNQYPMDFVASPFDNFGFQSFSVSPESDSSNDNYFNNQTKPNCFPIETPLNDHYVDQIRPTKKIKTSPQLISFENATPIVSHSKKVYNLDYSDVKPKIEKGCNENKDSNVNHSNNQTMRNTTQAQDHVMAERKRREKLTRSFIALSAIIPGLKKMDKASVLGDAIKYMKQLKARLQTLEEQAEDKKITESAILVKRSVIFTDEDDFTHDNKSLPEIEVRVSSNDVLIKIQCEKHSGCAATVLGELEKHNLTIQSSSFLPFGNNIVDVTIVAQMNKVNCVTAKDLLGSLRQALIVHN